MLRRAPHVGAIALAAAGAACEVVAPIPDLTSGAGATEAGAGDTDGSVANGAEASTDGGVAPAPPGCPPTALYCNPFEAASTLSDFAADTIGVRIDPTVASSGKSSLRLDRQSLTRNGVFRLGEQVKLPRTVFARAMVKLDRAAGTIFFIGRPDFSDGVQTYLGDDQALHVAKYGGDDTRLSAAVDPLPWHCIELGIDDGTHMATVWLDGGPSTSASVAGASLPYDMVALIVTANQTTGAWYDDFVVDTRRIGCP